MADNNDQPVQSTDHQNDDIFSSQALNEDEKLINIELHGKSDLGSQREDPVEKAAGTPVRTLHTDGEELPRPKTAPETFAFEDAN